MRRRRRTLGYCVIRSLAGAGLLYGLVLAVVVPLDLATGPPLPPQPVHPDDSTARTVSPEQTTWASALARRFPGCGDMAEWSGEQQPTTVVVARGDGTLAEVPFARAYVRAREAAPTGRYRIIGACR